MASAPPPPVSGPLPEEQVQQMLQKVRGDWAAHTAPDGPFPMAEEEVPHFGTKQRYRCFQKGPNSLVKLTLPEFFFDAFARYADQEFLVYENVQRWTYGEVGAAAAALARELRASYKIARGDTVAIAGRNCPEWVITVLAVTGFLGAVALPVNSWWVGEELRYGLEDSGSKLLVADAERLSRAPFLQEIGVQSVCLRAPDDPPLGGAPPGGARTWESVLAAGRKLPALPPQPVDQEDRCMLMYTSGTTNKPKGVVMTHRGVMSAMNMYRMMLYQGDVPPPPVQICTLLGSPLFHVNGTHVGLFAGMVRGSKMVLMRKWNAQRALELTQQERIMNLVGVPTMTYEMVNHPDFAQYDTSSLVMVGGGGAAFAAPMIKRVADKFKKARANTGYGLTETNAFTVVMPMELFPSRPTSCGLPLANIEICILSDDNKKLPPGGVGEICIRGSTLMSEYWNKPDKTKEVFYIDEEGKLWFRSGDIGALDKDGFVFIMDRAKDIIIRGGENISCAEVEAALFEHPSVAEVAAVGAPDDNLGEIVVVTIVFRQGVPPPPAEELRAHCAARLANFKVPAEYITWDGAALPRGATGKVQKREIREHLQDMRKKLAGAPVSRL